MRVRGSSEFRVRVRVGVRIRLGMIWDSPMTQIREGFSLAKHVGGKQHGTWAVRARLGLG